ncbi:hypothetical protein [Sanyastnella coralliicola]|uniref:hypothetical protein n=1 Tax=Sanyastnella coralliicola TaxID=3069118 RepID=UPI0027BA8260|nr:hypothetical protein [Longitalea sp. SCSIO 12813]
MKTFCTLLAGFLLCFNASAQCMEVNTVAWSDDEFTITVQVSDQNLEIVQPDGSITSADEMSMIYFTAEIDRSGDTFAWFVNGEANSCTLFFDPDEATIVFDFAISTQEPGECEGADGSVCVNLNGYDDVAFSMGATEAVNGCISDLEADDYTLTFDDIIGNDGVRYMNSNKDVSIAALQVVLASAEGNLTPEIDGGSGNYSYVFDGYGEDEPILSFTEGCFTVEVTDLDTGCKTTHVGYATPSILGDFKDAFNMDGYDARVTASDLMATLGLYGTMASTKADFNCSGHTGIEDLLQFLTAFGTGVE